MKNTLYKKLRRLRERARRTGVAVSDPLTTIEKTTNGVLVLRDYYGNRYQEEEDRPVAAAVEEFPESFPKISLSKLMPPLRMARDLGRSTVIKLKKRELQLHIGESYVYSIPLPSV